MPTERLPCATFAKRLRANHNLGMPRRAMTAVLARPGTSQQDLNLVRRAVQTQLRLPELNDGPLRDLANERRRSVTVGIRPTAEGDEPSGINRSLRDECILEADSSTASEEIRP